MKVKRNLKAILLMGLCTVPGFPATAQELWNMDRCIHYAVQHAHRVQKSRVEAENAELNARRAAGAFIPNLNAGVGGQVSWGRNVDPETNTYNTITTLNNSYQLSTGVTVWDGMQSINSLKQARLQMRQSRNDLQETCDQIAIETMRCFIDALYSAQSAELAAIKREDSRRMLEKTRRMADLGTKGMPDVAQMEAQMANDAYEAVRQQNAAQKALHQLKLVMNFPAEDTLALAVLPQDTLPTLPHHAKGLFRIPALVTADNNLQLMRYNQRMARGRFSPTLSLGAGVGTSYYRNLSTGIAVNGFGKQWKNNMGEYVSASLSVPLFNFGTLKDVRRARNQVRLAEISRNETQHQIQENYRQALNDAKGSRKEMLLMRSKKESDSIAHRLNCRRYEEGLLSALDLQTTAQTLHQSRIRLLQVMLTLAMQQRIVQYYQTGQIYKEEL